MTRAELLSSWLDSITGREWVWLAKRLSANDTGANGSHQVGLYVPNQTAFQVAPELKTDQLNPRVRIPLTMVSHQSYSVSNLIYYNNRRTGSGTRDECRLTGLGGRSSPLQDPESTQAIVLIAFDSENGRAEGWVTASGADDDLLGEEAAIEALLGPIEPGTVVSRILSSSGELAVSELRSESEACNVPIAQLPMEWTTAFPRGDQLTAEAVRRIPATGKTPDQRLLERHRCEFSLFRTVERYHTEPVIRGPFTSVDEFLAASLTVSQRRKSRAGRSLELQLGAIFKEEGLSFTSHGVTESGRMPDFIFPSIDAYRTSQRGDADVFILAAKTTLKDRWRQVLDEAAKAPRKYLFTLAEGASTAQVQQMTEGGLKLVVPRAHLVKFPPEVRPQLLNLTAFVQLVRAHGGS